MADKSVSERIDELFAMIEGVKSVVEELKQGAADTTGLESAVRRADDAERKAAELAEALAKTREETGKIAGRIKTKIALEKALLSEGALDVEAAMTLAGICDEKLDGLAENENKGEKALAQTVAKLREERPYIFKNESDDAQKTRLETPPVSGRGARAKNENISAASKLAARVYEAAAKEFGEKIR